MADIFEGLEKLSDDDIRLQIAILRNVNLFNTVMETGSRVMNRFISAAGNILSSISGSDKNDDTDVVNVKIIKVKDRIKQSFQELSGIGRERLDSILKTEIMEKCGLVQDEERQEYESGAVSVKVIREAAAAYLLDINQPPSVLADAVRDKYQAHILRVLHARLVREDEDTRRVTDGACTLVLRRISIERLRELNKELMLAQFNPGSIMEAVRSDKTARTLEKLVAVIGLEAFDPVRCIIATVNDGMKSLIRADRLLMANLVWSAAGACGKKFAVNGDILPSFVNYGRTSGVNEVDIRFIENVRRKDELERKVKRILSEITENNTRHVTLENELMQARLHYDEALMELEEAENRKKEADENGRNAKEKLDEYELGHPMNDSSSVEYRRLKSDYEMAASRVRVSSGRLERAEKLLKRRDKAVEGIWEKIDECGRQAVELGNRLYENTTEYNEVVFETDNEVLYRAQVLKKKWEQYFDNMKFDTNIFEDVVKLFNTSELHKLEYYIDEINNAADPLAYAHEVFAGDGAEREGTAYCLVSSGKYAVLRYREKTVVGISVKDR